MVALKLETSGFEFMSSNVGIDHSVHHNPLLFEKIRINQLLH